ncbi:MAG: hypothetical protein WBI17_00135 [Clostridiaceae bacterium]
MLINKELFFRTSADMNMNGIFAPIFENLEKNIVCDLSKGLNL